MQLTRARAITPPPAIQFDSQGRPWWVRCPNCLSLDGLTFTRIYEGGRGYVDAQQCITCWTLLGTAEQVSTAIRAAMQRVVASHV